MRDKNSLEIWTLYDHPKDHPNSWVVRRARVINTDVVHDLKCHTFATLEDANRWAKMHLQGFYWLDRMAEDDSVIVGCWI